MVRFELLLAAAALLDHASAINPKCSSYVGLNKLIATVAARVSPYPVAQSYCSKNYPIPTSTSISTASAQTSTTTVATTTLSTTVATSTTTSTFTDTFTTVQTVTVTAAAGSKKKLKRDPAPIPAPVTSPNPTTTRASTLTTVAVQATSAALSAAAAAAQASPSQVLNSLAAYNRAIAASICTCVESTPISVFTTTPTSTSSVTATSTSSITATSTASTTVTTTVTSTSMTTVAAPQATCVNQQRCYTGYLIQNYCNTKFNLAVGPSATINGVASGQDCGNGCASDSACVVFDFNSSTGQCQYFSSGTPATFNPSTDVNHYSGYLADYC